MQNSARSALNRTEMKRDDCHVRKSLQEKLIGFCMETRSSALQTKLDTTFSFFVARTQILKPVAAAATAAELQQQNCRAQKNHENHHAIPLNTLPLANSQCFLLVLIGSYEEDGSSKNVKNSFLDGFSSPF